MRYGLSCKGNNEIKMFRRTSRHERNQLTEIKKSKDKGKVVPVL